MYESHGVDTTMLDQLNYRNEPHPSSNFPKFSILQWCLAEIKYSQYSYTVLSMVLQKRVHLLKECMALSESQFFIYRAKSGRFILVQTSGGS